MKNEQMNQINDKVTAGQVVVKQSQSSNSPSIGFWKTILELLMRPSVFFEQTTNRTLATSVAFCYRLGILFGFSLLFYWVLFFDGYHKINTQLANHPGVSLYIIYTILFGLLIFVLSPIVLIILTIIRAAINHAALKLFRVEGLYSDSFHAFAYGLTPAVLLGFLPKPVDFIPSIYSMYITYIGLSKNHHLPLNRVIWISILADCIWLFLTVVVTIFVVVLVKS